MDGRSTRDAIWRRFRALDSGRLFVSFENNVTIFGKKTTLDDGATLGELFDWLSINAEEIRRNESRRLSTGFDDV